MEENPQMKIVATAADLHVELAWNAGEIDLLVKDTADDIPTVRPRELRKTIKTAQAAAIIALFVAGGDTLDKDVQEKLYAIAEEVLVGVPQNLRPIP